MLTLCNLPSKNEVEKYCRTLNIRQCDFVSFILHAQLGVFVPYKYACAFRDRQPPHLIPTADERAALGASGVGPLQGKATKALYKMSQMLVIGVRLLHTFFIRQTMPTGLILLRSERHTGG